MEIFTVSKAAPTVSVEALDRATFAVRDLEIALRGLNKGVWPDLQTRRSRFRLLCADLFGDRGFDLQGDPVLCVASLTVAAVELGLIGRRTIRAHIDERFSGMSSEDRAFAAGLAMGFVTEFLPRE